MKTKRILFTVNVILFRLFKWMKSIIVRKRHLVAKKELIDYYAMYHLS